MRNDVSRTKMYVIANWVTGEVLAIYDYYNLGCLGELCTMFQEELKYPYVLENRFPLSSNYCHATKMAGGEYPTAQLFFPSNSQFTIQLKNYLNYCHNIHIKLLLKSAHHIFLNFLNIQQ